MWITLIEKVEVAGQENDLGKGSFLDIQTEQMRLVKDSKKPI